MAKYNEMTVTGSVKNIERNDSRLNVTLLTNEESGKYINILISGEKKMKEFADANVKEKDISVTGTAYITQFNGNNNLTLLGNTFEQANENSKSNEVQIQGNLGNDIRVIESAKGEKFGAMSIAHNFTVKDERKTTWIDVVIPSKVLEELNLNEIKKGVPISLEGSYSQRTFENKAGEKKYSFNIVANSIDLNKKLIEARDNALKNNTQEKENNVTREL